MLYCWKASFGKNWDRSAPVSTPILLQRRWWVSKNLHMAFVSYVESWHWARNYPCFNYRLNAVQTRQTKLREVNCQALQGIGRQVLYFLVHRYFRSRRLKIGASLHPAIVGLPGQPVFSVLSIVLDAACLCFLHTEIIILSQDSGGIEG